MKGLLGKSHFLFSVQNPMHHVRIEPPTTDQAVQWLKNQGEDAQKVLGHYGQPEESILVKNPKNVAGLKQLAEDTGQDSVLHSVDDKHELQYVNGPKKGQVIRGTGTQIFAEPPADFYTTMVDEHGDKIHFSHNLDFPTEPAPKPKDDHAIPTRLLHKSELLEKADSNHNIRRVADQYAQSKGLSLQHDIPQVTVNPERATKIADAYHMANHEPNDPEVKRSYKALINETNDQFKHMLNSGVKISKIKRGQENPYKNSKDLFNDINQNNHISYFPTELGFGSQDGVAQDHPLNQPTEHMHEGKPMVANDIFRIVHDYFGHAKEGFGFGPNGEENAWKHHMQMYSPEAQKALTSETRGQNSFVNFGPNATHNRTNPSQTIYADQKATILPDWTMQHNTMTKSEHLQKAPMPYTDYDLESQKEQGLPDLVHNDDYKHVKSVKLPNGLEYRKYRHKNAIPSEAKHIHALYDPRDNWEPVAYMETQHEEDASAPKGYHPHTVSWSEVHPSLRGHGLGKQLYMATLLHGTGQLTSDDHVSPEAHKMWTSFKDTPGLGGKISMFPKGNELLFRPGLADKASERHHVFIRDKSKINQEQVFPFINLHKLAASEKTEEWLSKAIDDKSWARILKGHNKGAAEDVVDSAGHINYFQNSSADSHSDYKKNVLKTKNIPKATPTKGLGVTPKMIHDVGEDKYMAKPYHAPIESWSKSWSKHPIKGWASLTSRKLFEAAGMGDHTEDISAHIHKGVPIIVSKFHPGSVDSGDDQYGPPDVAKTNIMDFLMNNQDRHSGNVMTMPNSHAPLLIDHERNFQFGNPKPGFDANVSPRYALDNSAFRYTNHNLPHQIDQINDNLIDWWTNHSHNIKKEMQRNLQFIKDPAIKRHVEDNFNLRHQWITDKMGQDPSLMFDKNVPGVYPLPYVKDRKAK